MQIVGDGSGVHLLEPDRSLHPRHRKLIENAPSPFLPPAQRALLAEEARRLTAAGLIAGFEPPTGPGPRIDAVGRAGCRTTGSFDSLLAKVIALTKGDFATACRKSARALRDLGLAEVYLPRGADRAAGDALAGRRADRHRPGRSARR